jgi:asparagine synthase (glutamine-hydrolysing)
MCGIVGVWDGLNAIESNELEDMGNAMLHRGPDNQGYYINESYNIGVLNQRLSIIDINERSNQPLHSNDGRFTIVYNGEIYNYKILKTDLESKGVSFKTDSDTEVLLNLFSIYNEKCLELLNGMFAFAVLDNSNGELFIARDRLGIKPLYYCLTSNYFSFASDLKSFLICKNIRKNISKDAILQFLYFDYIPQPKTIYDNIYKLLPGHYIKMKGRGKISIKKYWDIDLNNKILESSNIINDFGQLFQDSVRIRQNADVKYGAFLSGGLDSSAVIANMTGDFSTYTIGFEKSTNDKDVQRSQLFLKSYKVENYLTKIGDKSLEDLIDFMSILDEPIAESSIVSLLANFQQVKNRDVRVILTGDGADEILGGYNYFEWIYKYYGNSKFQKNYYNLILKSISSLLKGFNSRSIPGKYRDLYIKRLLLVLNSKNLNHLHQFLFSARNLHSLNQLFKNDFNIIYDSLVNYKSFEFNPTVDAILYNETKTALINRHVSKLDKVSMSKSIEARVPFLDHRIIEYASSLPSHWRRDKKILKEAMKNKIPNEIISDKKRGFSLPIQNWVKDYVLKNKNKYILEENLIKTGIFDKKDLNTFLNHASKSNDDNSRLVWNLFILSHWLQHN